MNILHVSPRYLPAIGGAEKHLHEFSRRLVADGHRVRVLTTDALDADAFWNPSAARISSPTEVIDDVEVVRVPLRYLPGAPVSYRAVRRALSILSGRSAPLPLLNRLARLAPRTPDLATALRDGEKWDLYAGMNIAYEGVMIPASDQARKQGKPWIIFPLTHLGDSSHDAAIGKFYTMRQQLALIHSAAAVFSQTARESQLFTRRRIDPRKLIRLGPGVNPRELAGGDEDRARATYDLNGPVVLFVGAASEDKGALTLLGAMRIGEEFPGLNSPEQPAPTLVLAGAVTDEWRRALANEPDEIKARVRVLGPVSDESKKDLLAACALLALPSRVDSFGIVLLEAWIYGKPVVGAAAGGIPDVIADGQDGILVPFGDTRALAGAIRRLIDDPALARAMGQRGCDKTMAHHTWDEKYKVVREVYARVARGEPLDDLAERAA